MEYIKLRQCKLGELRWVAAVSRPDICARLARIASRITALCGSDVYRINELARVVTDWQQATAPGRGGKVPTVLRKRGEKAHGGSTTLAGWPDVAYGDQSTECKSRLGYAVGLMSSTMEGPPHILRRTSKFARKVVKSSLDGGVYALSEMVDHV